MAKIPISFDIDGNLLAHLEAYAAQTGCTVTELIERFCQQGLGMASQESTPAWDAQLERHKNNLQAERLEVVELEVKSILERLSLLESKVDVDIDVHDFLENWQKSLELKVESLVDNFVNKRVPTPTRYEEHLDVYQIDSDVEDEPDEILTDFLEPNSQSSRK